MNFLKVDEDDIVDLEKQVDLIIFNGYFVCFKFILLISSPDANLPVQPEAQATVSKHSLKHILPSTNLHISSNAIFLPLQASLYFSSLTNMSPRSWSGWKKT